jgi:hypothetical protein
MLTQDDTFTVLQAVQEPKETSSSSRPAVEGTINTEIIGTGGCKSHDRIRQPDHSVVIITVGMMVWKLPLD